MPTTPPIAPRLVKGGLVTLDPDDGTVDLVLPLQYNAETVTRSLQVQGAGEQGGERSEALRLTGPPVETWQVEVEIDAADLLEDADTTAEAVGLHPWLAALELLVHPGSAQLQSALESARAGVFEIAPVPAPLTLFVWSSQRVMPVRITELSITEEAFDPQLNPIRATVTLGLRVLGVSDLGHDHRGGGLFMAYLRTKEGLAKRQRSVALDALGIGGIP